MSLLDASDECIKDGHQCDMLECLDNWPKHREIITIYSNAITISHL